MKLFTVGGGATFPVPPQDDRWRLRYASGTSPPVLVVNATGSNTSAVLPIVIATFQKNQLPSLKVYFMVGALFFVSAIIAMIQVHL